MGAGGPGGDYTPPLLGPPSLVTVGSVHYDDDRECESDLSVATNSELHEEDTEDVYGTAFAPSPPPPNEDLTSSAINRIVDRQIEKYNVNVTTGYQVRPEEQRPREIEHTQVETAQVEGKDTATPVAKQRSQKLSRHLERQKPNCFQRASPFCTGVAPRL